MGVRLQEVCVVPFGKERLTNAYGGWGQVSVTDDYGHWLAGSQLDFVIAHELTHVEQKHGLKKLLAILGIFAVFSALALALPSLSCPWYVLFDFCAILVPLLCFYFLSRQFEYAADKRAVQLLANGEVAVVALIKLYRRAGVPKDRNKLEEFFSTHPSLTHRIDSIALVANISRQRIAELEERLDSRASVQS